MSYLLLVQKFLLISAVWKRDWFGRARPYANIMFFIYFKGLCLPLKNCYQHKVTTNWNNDLSWDVPQKSVSVSPDFKIFPFQFPWFQSCASTSAPSATENQPVESLESKITFSLVSLGMVNHLFFIFFARFTMFSFKLDRQLIRKINRFGFSFRKQNSVE